MVSQRTFLTPNETSVHRHGFSHSSILATYGWTAVAACRGDIVRYCQGTVDQYNFEVSVRSAKMVKVSQPPLDVDQV